MRKTNLFLAVAVLATALTACGNAEVEAITETTSIELETTSIELETIEDETETIEVEVKVVEDSSIDDLLLLEAYEQNLLDTEKLLPTSEIIYKSVWGSDGSFSGFSDSDTEGTGLLSTEIIACDDSYYLVTSSVKELTVYVMVYVVSKGEVIELTNEAFSYELGTCEDYVQIAYEQIDNKLRLYLTTTGFVSSWEGGYLIEYAAIYDFEDETLAVVLDNEKGWIGDYDYEGYLPNTVQLANDLIAEYGMYYNIPYNERENFAFILDLSETEPGLTMLSRLYLYPDLSIGLNGYCTDYS